MTLTTKDADDLQVILDFMPYLQEYLKSRGEYVDDLSTSTIVHVWGHWSLHLRYISRSGYPRTRCLSANDIEHVIDWQPQHTTTRTGAVS